MFFEIKQIVNRKNVKVKYYIRDLPISQEDAIKQNCLYYYPNKKCRQNHDSLFRTKDKRCLFCRNKTNKAYRKRDSVKYKNYKERKNSAAKIKYYNEHEFNLKRKRENALSNPASVFARKTIERMEKYISKIRISKYEDILGYTQTDFINHIESLFKKGMTWENRSEWHIDHIRPLKLFIEDGVTDVSIINALSNLQPLWAKENLSKGAKY